MSDIILLSDSSCDLPESLLKKYNIEIIPYYVSFDGEHYAKEIKELSISNFYDRLRSEKIFPKTSLPSINDYYEHFEPLVKNNKSVICVCLSSHFSGSFNAAVNARELILENYPSAKIEIINSLNATGGQGVLVQEIARMIEDGFSYEKIIETAYKMRETARTFFFVETLDYLEHGGRIGKASALLGSMLNVKPVIYLNEGVLFPCGKVRGTKKAMAKILDLTKDYIEGDSNSYHYLIAHADNLEYADTIREELGTLLDVSIPKHYAFVGATIGVYTGPDVVGICLIKKYENFV